MAGKAHINYNNTFFHWSRVLHSSTITRVNKAQRILTPSMVSEPVVVSPVDVVLSVDEVTKPVESGTIEELVCPFSLKGW